MGKKSTRTKNIEILKQACNHIDAAADKYDLAIEVYLDQFPQMEVAFKHVLELLQLAKTMMESSFDGI